jgi:demethylmenaquinone methyltransferase/2-methoxy-6-polyprenyl-1,4-benzoquinol methylase
MGIDQGWRRKVVRMLGEEPVGHLLDVATGTADLAILGSLKARQVTGADISEGMLKLGREKVARRGLADRVTLVQANSEQLPFPNATFDAVTVAFGVRNFEHLEQGVKDMVRVLRPGGRIFILEFSKPAKAPFKQLFRFYFHRVMPTVGKAISKDSAAYAYLPKSVDAFPEGAAFEDLMRAAGLGEVRSFALTGGIATLYRGRRPATH